MQLSFTNINKKFDYTYILANNLIFKRKSYQQFADSKKTSIFAVPNPESNNIKYKSNEKDIPTFTKKKKKQTRIP